MRKVAVIGAGGIGSWLAFFLFDSQKNDQFYDIGFTFYDDDTVEEKNLKYQKFERIDIMDYKAECISSKYGFNGVVKRVTDLSILDEYSCIICAVDGKEFRLKLFEYLEQHPGKYWIDLRSEGRACVFYTKHDSNSYEKMMGTLPSGEAEEGSCQLEFELAAGRIQQGNKIIATIGSQLVLNWVRGDYNAASGVYNI